jgi:hypothetical protein
VIATPQSRPLRLAFAGLAVAGAALLFNPPGTSGPASVQASSTGVVPPLATTAAPVDELVARIERARRQGMAALDALVAELETTAAEDGTDPSPRHALAEALLERSLLRDIRKGMAVGKPTHAELPEALAADVAAGIGAAEQAIEAGDDTAEIHRILSALLSRQVTGIGSALRLRGRIDAELKLAEEREPEHPKVLIARGCGQLFAPNRLFGHDPEAAEAKFMAAAESLPSDERPLMFASMCAWLLGDRDRALTHIEAAAARNPSHPYVDAVAQRLRDGVTDPFGPDA